MPLSSGNPAGVNVRSPSPWRAVDAEDSGGCGGGDLEDRWRIRHPAIVNTAATLTDRLPGPQFRVKKRTN
jgi:hypothetical protein